MKKVDVVVDGLVPASQNASKTVHPAVSTFYHPASGFEAGFPFDGLSLFAPPSPYPTGQVMVVGRRLTAIRLTGVEAGGRGGHPLEMATVGSPIGGML